MYYIYHIKKYIWNDGSIGKIGVTKNLKDRVRRYKDKNIKLSDVEILEKYDCKYKVSEREIELQKEYGYKVDKKPYYKQIEMSNQNVWSKGGKVQGKLNYLNGNLDKARKKSVEKISVAVVQLDLNGNFIKKWESSAQAAKSLNTHSNGIYAVLKGRAKTCVGYKWKFLKDVE